MAVKQKVVECVAPTEDARLQIILRALQDISAQHGFRDKLCAQIVMGLGTVPIPSELDKYMKFIDDIKKVESILLKECSDEKYIFIALKALYDEICDPSKVVSPAASIVLQLIEESDIPTAVKYILNAGYPEQNIERALYVLCTWLSKCMIVDNLGPLVLAFMKGLEAERHYDILVDVTMATIESLFKLTVLPNVRKNVGPVVLYMLSKNQQNPKVFHKIVPHVPTVCKHLDQEKSETASMFLQEIVNLCMALMEHFPKYPEIYDNLNQALQPYYPNENYKQRLHCKSWDDGTNVLIPYRHSSGKVGLNNLGNTCYMNSVLQALYMTKVFRNEVLLYNKGMLPLFSKLQVLFVLLQHSKRFLLSPKDILSLSRPPGFILGHQHDSSEFLGYLLDTLHEQEKNVASSSSSSSSVVKDEDGAASVAVIPTIVQQAFGGRTLTVSGCGECTTRSERADNFRELQLSVPNQPDHQSVQTLLDYYLQAEKLCGDNQYHCEVCCRLTDGERITMIMEAPPRLILTLKRFRFDPISQQRTKLLQVVQLDRYIRLDKHQYELYAAVVHCGSSVDSGHYYTFAKDQSDWYKFNDSSVIKTSFEDLCKLKPPETPYVLFYSREDISEPEDLPQAVLPPHLKNALKEDQAAYDAERASQTVKIFDLKRGNRDDDKPPPSCGGGGFAASNGNMFVC